MNAPASTPAPGPGPAPPPPPPPPPAPLPGPPPNGWSHVYSQARKPVITPKTSMRPLFWSRIQVQDKPSKTLWQDLEEIKLGDDSLEEFCNLFKRNTTTQNFNRNISRKVRETVSLLDPKRAHTVNILVTSRHLHIDDIKTALYEFDFSVIDVETLKQVHEVAGTAEELQTIEAFVSNNEHGELGKAELFIRQLSQIDKFHERFKCIMFEVWASEQIRTIDTKLSNFRHMCEVLRTSESIKYILSIILGLGNYMNGGNRDRGQADGFGLEILPKLRDVKSATSSSVTLLHYVVQTYIRSKVPPGIVSFDEIKKPLPESTDLEQASTVIFDDIDQDLKSLEKQIDECREFAERVDGEQQEPFRSHMHQVFTKISEEHLDQRDNLQDCKQAFVELQEYFCWTPKSQEPVKEFFRCWIPFCRDFETTFKYETLRKIKSELESVKARVRTRSKDIKTTKATSFGLKAKLKAKSFLKM